MARLKIYYPENQIVRNLTALPNQWMLEDGTEYVGPYHKYSTGEVYTEGSWNEFQSKKLIPYKVTFQVPENTIYDKITKTPVNQFNAPGYYYPILKESDYANGSITRYFVQRNNLSNPLFSIIEINKEQFSKIVTSGKGINGNLYNGISIPWKLTGPKNDSFDLNGVRVETGVEDTNRRIVSINNVKMPGLINFLNDYIELSIYSLAVPIDIKNKFL